MYVNAHREHLDAKLRGASNLCAAFLSTFLRRNQMPRKENLDTRFSVALQGNRVMNNTP